MLVVNRRWGGCAGAATAALSVFLLAGVVVVGAPAAANRLLWWCRLIAVMRDEAREEAGDVDEDEEDFREVTEEEVGAGFRESPLVTVLAAIFSCWFVCEGECLRGNATGVSVD